MQNTIYNKKKKGKKNEAELSGVHVVRFIGGLGNQLFQYALYMAFINRGYLTFSDTKEARNGDFKREYQLEILGIKMEEAPRKYISELYAPNNKYLRAIIKRIRKKTYYRQRDLFYDESILMTKCGYFDGFWQSYRYFEDVSDTVRQSITFPAIKNDDENGTKVYNSIIENNDASVSIHVRLGDYLKLSKIYGNICNQDYYDRAIQYIIDEFDRRKQSKPKFYVFSNDIDAAKELFTQPDITFVKGHSEADGYIDMNLMRLCKHHIIANSSFSWWGAFLGQYEGTITIAPSQWMNGRRCEDVIPHHWIEI